MYNLRTILTKSHLIDAIAEQNEFTKKKSTEIVVTILETIKSTLAFGEDFLISGFGKFCVKDKRERKGRNPATGEYMMLAPRRVMTFRCSGTGDIRSGTGFEMKNIYSIN